MMRLRRVPSGPLVKADVVEYWVLRATAAEREVAALSTKVDTLMGLLKGKRND